MKRLSVTILGGSNTVMEPGYLSTALGMAERRGVRLDVAANLAVGGTTSACGLYRLKAEEAAAASDLLVIEYALNDAFIHGDERRPVRQWARLYEGVIRHALARNPRLRIVSLIFGARNGSFLSAVPGIDSGIHYLSAWYGTHVVDVSGELVRRYGRDVVTHPQFYSDQGHYARPIATGMVADIVAEGLARAAEAGPRSAPLPPPVDAGNFADAGILTGADLARLAGRPTTRYENRRFGFDAFDLGEDALCFRLEGGKLVALLYVADAATGGLAILRGDSDEVEAAMMKSGVANGKFRFLAGMLPCDFLYGARLLQPDTDDSYRLRLVGRHDPSRLHVPKDSTRHAEDAQPKRLPVIGLLYSGTIRDVALQGRSGPAREALPQPAVPELLPA